MPQRRSRHHPESVREAAGQLRLVGSSKLGQQAQITQTGMATAADDQVIMNGNAEWSGGPDDVLSDRNIRSGRCWIAGRVIMHQNEC